jgi:hypothetical protein
MPMYFLRFISVFLVFVILFGFSVHLARGSFNDVPPSNEHFDAIEYLEDQEIFYGAGGGYFLPDNTLNRAEFATILVRFIGESPSLSYSNCFPDVREEWYAPAVCYAKQQGWITGYEAGEYAGMYGPALEVQDIEVLVMLSRLTNWDMEEDSVWYEPALDFAQDTGIWDEPSPIRGISRGETAETMVRTLAIASLGHSFYYPELLGQVDDYDIEELVSFMDGDDDVEEEEEDEEEEEEEEEEAVVVVEDDYEITIYEETFSDCDLMSCGADQMCYGGECVDTCLDLDGGYDPYTRGELIYLSEDSSLLQIYDDGAGISPSMQERYCENGEPAWELYTCPVDSGGGACMDKEEEWDNFLAWLDDHGYVQEIIDYYDALHEDPDYEDWMIDAYIGYRNSIEDENSIFSIYKNSQQGEPLVLKMTEFYPIEDGWTLKRSTEQWAEIKEKTMSEFLEEKAEALSLGLGREVVIELVKRYVSYDDLFFSGGIDYEILYAPQTVYVANGTSHVGMYPTEYDWEEVVTDGFYDFAIYSDDTDYDQLSLLFKSSDLVMDAPGGIYVFMGEISPDNLFLSAFGTLMTGCSASSFGIGCGDVGSGYSLWGHELGHLLHLQHGYVSASNLDKPMGMPTIMGGTLDDWPCYNDGNSDWHDTTYAPIERYAIEPHDGFEDEEEFVQEYNEALLCP